MRMDWNADAIGTLRKLVGAGYSASAIGAALGCSRNAVIGKVERLCRRDPFFPALGGGLSVRKLSHLQAKKAGRRRSLRRRSLAKASGDNGATARGDDRPADSVTGDASRPSPGGGSRAPFPPMGGGAIDAVKGRARLSDAVGVEPPPPAPVAPPPDAVPLMALAAGCCKWPVAERAGAHLFCARPAEAPQKPYCPEHAARAFGGRAGSDGEAKRVAWPGGWRAA